MGIQTVSYVYHSSHVFSVVTYFSPSPPLPPSSPPRDYPSEEESCSESGSSDSEGEGGIARSQKRKRDGMSEFFEAEFHKRRRVSVHCNRVHVASCLFILPSCREYGLSLRPENEADAFPWRHRLLCSLIFVSVLLQHESPTQELQVPGMFTTSFI